MPLPAVKERNLHREAIEISTALSRYYVMNFKSPDDVIRVLTAAKVRFVLVGAHGILDWTDEPRATQDVDVVVGYNQHQKATRALLAAYPKLEVDDQEVVVRLRDPESGRVVIDVIKANQPLTRVVLKHVRIVETEELSYRVPSLEMALALKFAPMVSPNRIDVKKHLDASDFILMVRRNPNIDLDVLAQLGELVYPGGGKEIVEKVQEVREGKTLQL